MHVLHRPHLPRLISVSIAAALLAIAISLAFAASISNITQPTNNTSVSARAPVLASSAVHTTTPRWASDPFASLISQPAPLPWLTARP